MAPAAQGIRMASDALPCPMLALNPSSFAVTTEAFPALVFLPTVRRE
jgi:hypothetical protein